MSPAYPAAMTAPHPPTTVVFDLGGVLLGWDPTLAFVDVLDPGEVHAFLDEVGFAEWNHLQDSGRSYADGAAELAARFPHRAQAIAAYGDNWQATITGELTDSVEVVDELHRDGVRLLALTNWSHETFPWARETFAVLRRFEGIVVSGDERLAKPDPQIFRVLLDRYGVDPREAVFVDDRHDNVEAARALGLHGLVFTDAPTLRADLLRLGLLGGPGGPDGPDGSDGSGGPGGPDGPGAAAAAAGHPASGSGGTA